MTEALQQAVEAFAEADVDTRRLMLLEYAEELPELPDRYRAAMEAGLGRVHECQSPVFVYPELVDGRLALYAYAPREAPTVRGVVSLLVQTLEGASPEAVAALPDDLFARMGLVQAIGLMRQRGLAAVLARVKHAVAEHVP